MYKLCILFAGILWGSMGIFVKSMRNIGFTTFEIVFIRVFVSLICMAVYIYIKDKKLFKVKIKDLPLFFGSGVVSFVFFTFCYFSSMQLCSISVAAVLLYTSPIFVMIMARIFFKEKITPKKAAAAVAAVAGCAFVSGVFSESNRVTALGLSTGIGSGVGYALYSIFTKAQLKKYEVPTATFYTFLFASVFCIPFLSADTAAKMLTANGAAWSVSIGIVTCFAAYLLYNFGLGKTPAGKAAVIAAIEPVAAAAIGVTLYNETLDKIKLVGMLLVIFSVILLGREE